MAKTSLRLSKLKDCDGKSQIIVKLIVNSSCRPCFKSGIFVKPEYFKPVGDGGNGRGCVYGIVPPKKGRLNYLEVTEAMKAKNDLKAYISRLEKVCQVLMSEKREITHDSIAAAMEMTNDIATEALNIDSIREAVKRTKLEQKKARTSFLEWYNLFMEEHGKGLSKGRVKRFQVIGRMFARYEAFNQAVNDEAFKLDIDKFDGDQVEDFYDYLVNEKALADEYPTIFKKLVSLNPVDRSDRKQVIKERGRNVMATHMTVVKEFFNWLNKQGYTDNKPFANVKIEAEKYGTPYYLTLEERNKVADADLKTLREAFKAKGKGFNCKSVEALEVQRDIFIFQCCVGCRVSDLVTFTPSNLDYSRPGKVCLEYIPHKTRNKRAEAVRVPLNSRAIALVEKYKGKDKKDRIFPFIAPQNYNDAIKDVLRVCGIDRNITRLNPITGEEEQRPIWEVASSHMARRTFIGNLYFEVKDPNLIGSMTGHVYGSRSFARYRDITDDTKEDVVSLID